MIAERVMNILTLVVIAAVFLLKAVAYLIPWRGIDRLRLCLALVDLTIAILFGVALLEIARVVVPPPPLWYLWGIRLALIVTGSASVIELIKAGALRAPRGDDS